MRSSSVRIVSLSTLLLVPVLASAHAFGVQYTLALPISFFILGGTGAFLASSCIILLFSTPKRDVDISAPRSIAFPGARILTSSLQGFGIALLLFELALCFLGGTNFVVNPAIVLFWVYLLLGIAYLSVFVDGIWDQLNPWRTLAGFISKQPLYDYPKALGYIPAFLVFFFLIRFELFSGGDASVPAILGTQLVLYTFVTLVGSKLFGREEWFSYADVFSVFFGTLGRCAPLRLTENTVEQTKPGARLVEQQPMYLSHVLFILFMLSSTALDGIKETGVWWSFFGFFKTHGVPLDSNQFGVFALLLAPFVFFLFYGLAILCMRLLTKNAHSRRYLLLRFGYSLIPIAIAYHFAHYFTIFIGESQRLIYQLSDPFGLGWDIFGTAKYTINPVPLGADIIWYIQLGVIVFGHVIAAFIAHRIAVREFKTVRDVVWSQLPMLVLMVGYTALGLWILSRAFAPG